MPLIIEPLKQETDEIKFGDVTLQVPARVPFELMIEFYELRNLKAESMTAKDILATEILTKRILYLTNDRAVVDDMFSRLVMEDVGRVITFVTNYIVLAASKKKDSPMDSDGSSKS